MTHLFAETKMRKQYFHFPDTQNPLARHDFQGCRGGTAKSVRNVTREKYSEGNFFTPCKRIIELKYIHCSTSANFAPWA